MSGPRVYDGSQWTPVTEEGPSGPKPPLPVEDGDGKIFVVLPSFRDGPRCADTVKSLFDNAADPDRIVVGLIEQNAPEDQFCMEIYCQKFHQVSKFYRRVPIRKDVTKVMAEPERLTCPRFDQVRHLAFHNLSAKGPTYARSMTRKILANDEFCMQIDAHMEFAKGWDAIAKEEWRKAENEFAVISNAPAGLGEKTDLSEGGAKATEVPRQCAVMFADNGIPNYLAPGDGMVADLQKPLLANTWSSGFSFAKCHLEESAPYDPYTPYVMGAEQFPRFVRMWTRGYDVYTPTRNIVFHNYQPQADHHDMSEWFRQRRDRIRNRSLNRIKTVIQVKGGDTTDTAKANMGIYGLGKRRTLNQLNQFVGIDLASGTGNRQNVKCANLKWVPYDPEISPTDNLYKNPNDLDNQPEYPRRTEMKYYKQVEQLVVPPTNLDAVMSGAAGSIESPGVPPVHNNPFPPASTMFTLWLLGLVLWCFCFLGSGKRTAKRKKMSGYKSV